MGAGNWNVVWKRTDKNGPARLNGPWESDRLKKESPDSLRRKKIREFRPRPRFTLTAQFQGSLVQMKFNLPLSWSGNYRSQFLFLNGPKIPLFLSAKHFLISLVQFFAGRKANLKIFTRIFGSAPKHFFVSKCPDTTNGTGDPGSSNLYDLILRGRGKRF